VFFLRRPVVAKLGTPLLCGFIADRCSILGAFFFLAGTVFVADLIVMAIRKEGKESSGLVQERV
jgi:hypothetical protein